MTANVLPWRVLDLPSQSGGLPANETTVAKVLRKDPAPPHTRTHALPCFLQLECDHQDFTFLSTLPALFAP